MLITALMYVWKVLLNTLWDCSIKVFHLSIWKQNAFINSCWFFSLFRINMLRNFIGTCVGMLVIKLTIQSSSALNKIPSLNCVTPIKPVDCTVQVSTASLALVFYILNMHAACVVGRVSNGDRQNIFQHNFYLLLA